MDRKHLKVWLKSNGKCYYCGKRLSVQDGLSNSPDAFAVDHFVSKYYGGSNHLDNLVPCCCRCNSSKGYREIEHFRFHVSQKKSNIKKKYGVSFSYGQYLALKQMGFELPIPMEKFWYETQNEEKEINK